MSESIPVIGEVRAHVVNSMRGRWDYTRDMGDGRLTLQSHDKTRLCVTDSRLEPIWEWELPASHGNLSVSSDLSRIAVSLEDELRLIDPAGRIVGRLPHPPAGWADAISTFDGDGRHLWATVPTTEDSALVVLELDGLRELHRKSLQSRPAGVGALHHPDGRNIGWSIGEGQDRALIRWSSLLDDRIQLRLLADENRVLIAIHPTGDEYLTTPHSAGPLQRHRFKDDAAIGQLDPGESFLWDFVAGYLDAERILASIRTEDDDNEGLLLVARSPMNVAAKVKLKGSANRWSSLNWVGGSTWVMAGDVVTELWALD